jgi:hypothetical protein
LERSSWLAKQEHARERAAILKEQLREMIARRDQRRDAASLVVVGQAQGVMMDMTFIDQARYERNNCAIHSWRQAFPRL